MKQPAFLACVCALCLLLLVGCTRRESAPPPPSTQNPPVYPGARQLEISSEPGYGPVPAKVIAYSVTAQPAAVFGFYDNALSKDNWKVSHMETSNELNGYWTDNCPEYHLIVSALPQDNGVSNVTLKLTTSACID